MSERLSEYQIARREAAAGALNEAIKWWLDKPKQARRELVDWGNWWLNQARITNREAVSEVDRGVEVVAAVAFVNPLGYLPEGVEADSPDGRILRVRYKEGENLLEQPVDTAYDGDGLHKKLWVGEVAEELVSGVTFRIYRDVDWLLEMIGVLGGWARWSGRGCRF